MSAKTASSRLLPCQLREIALSPLDFGSEVATNFSFAQGVFALQNLQLLLVRAISYTELAGHLQAKGLVMAPSDVSPANLSQFDLVAYLPCPIKVPFEQLVNEYLDSVGAPPHHFLIEGNANKSESDYASLLQAREAKDLPSLVITPGVNSLFGQKFLAEVLDKGAFADRATYRRDPERPEDGLRDPLGTATVLAANVTLFVVDLTQLGDRPVPKTWHDLQDPRFENAIIMRGNGKTFCETTLLAWYHLFGDEGLRNMGRSIREGMHPAQMAKLAGTGHASGAAVYVMPYFFARNIVRKERVSIVWPEPGAIASPVTMFVKKEIPEWLSVFAHWLAGPTVARMFAHAGLPTPHPEIGSGLPEPGRYVWSGWERARSSDLQAVLAAAEAAFASGRVPLQRQDAPQLVSLGRHE